MKAAAAHCAYDVLGSVALTLALPVLWSRDSRDGLAQRLGRVPLPAGGFSQRPFWLHAASVGETRAVLPLYESLQQGRPSIPWVVSTTTETGRAVARREMAPTVSTLLPVDGFRIVDRAFARVRPRALIVVENEMWPGMLRAAQRVGATILLVSARISPRALDRYRWAQPLFGAALQRVDVICAQSEDDADRFCELGAPRSRVRVTGNLKAARSADALRSPPLDLGDRPLLVAASTQPGEEALVLDACAGLWPDVPQALLLLAPRRPERFGEVAEMLERRGVPYQRRSASESAVLPGTAVLLLDTLGELADFLPGARAAFVGGTIAPIGGHNVLEPATAGVPVAFGPHVENVRHAAQALGRSEGAVEVLDAGSLRAHWVDMLRDRDAARAMGDRARLVADDLAGSIGATVAAIEPHLAAEPGGAS